VVFVRVFDRAQTCAAATTAASDGRHGRGPLPRSSPRLPHRTLRRNEVAFLHPLPNKWLPGVGPKTSARLNAAGLARICHIAGTPLEMLELLLGNQAACLRQFAHGIDERPLIPVREPQKSFSQQETFASEVTDGAVEFVQAAKQHVVKPILGTELHVGGQPFGE
jgi:nucleotidyltransferase/DNA polymerase involved in DNA repair